MGVALRGRHGCVGCEDAKGHRHLQNLQRRCGKANLLQSTDGEGVAGRSWRGPPQGTRLPHGPDRQLLRRWNRERLHQSRVVQRLLWLLLRGCPPSKEGGCEPFRVCCSILQETQVLGPGQGKDAREREGVDAGRNSEMEPTERTAGLKF